MKINHFIFAYLLIGVVVCDFVCQDTIDFYNSHVNVGNFTGASLTFSDDVVYVIPGNASYCPYCDVYVGKSRVISLFVDGFLGHFTILNPLFNQRQLQNNQAGKVELWNVNDEAFRLKSKYGRGSYFRVPVIHDFTFNQNCQITGMTLYHDPYVASMCFEGYSATAVPIMPGISQNPPQKYQLKKIDSINRKIFFSKLIFRSQWRSNQLGLYSRRRLRGRNQCNTGGHLLLQKSLF
jgi:hypothetical protein